MSSLKTHPGSTPGQLVAELIGNIGETSEIFNLKVGTVSELIVDFKFVTYINSVGVKNWIFWSGRLPPTIKVSFVNCISAVVNQINTVKGFLPKNGTVNSFFVPYHCENCSHEERLLAEKGVHFDFATDISPASISISEKMPCPNCKGEMDMDVIPDRYFAFLKG